MTAERLRALPCWTGPITAERLPGGLSNEAWKVTDAAGVHVVRFGEDYPFHHVERAREAAVARAAHAAGFGPAVEYAAPGVSVFAYVPARTWSEADVRAAPERVGALLRAFHDGMPRHVAGPAHLFWPFHVIRDYARTLRAGGGADPRLDGWLALAERLEGLQAPMPIVFGHHDLLPANFLDDGARLWLIDYEYAGFGTATFDLAGAASNAGMSAAETEALLVAYFGAPPGPAFLRSFDAMRCTSLLREALWGLVSERHLAATGVDYRAYAQENLERLAAARAEHVRKHGDDLP